MVDRMAPPKTIICMPTRVLSISDLAACTYRADRCIAVRLLEDESALITGRQTSSETVHMLERFFTSLGYLVSVTQDLAQASVT